MSAVLYALADTVAVWAPAAAFVLMAFVVAIVFYAWDQWNA